MALERFPGLIDVHVHLRDPGETQKEDFLTGSRAAVKGGFTFVCDMPNNRPKPTTSVDRIHEKMSLVSQKSLCDIGFHFGTDGKNLGEFAKAAASPSVYGLKVYCSKTTGNLIIQDEFTVDSIFKAWESSKPILVHAESEKLQLCIELAKKYNRRIHVCHISEIASIASVRHAKENGQLVTSGVTPHHLFLKKTDAMKLGPFGLVKPPLVEEDVGLALWEALDDGTIDVIESDHAPHTKEEKRSGALYYGVPGLETTLLLLVHAFVEEKLSLESIRTLLYDNPKKIFGIPDQPDTFIEFDPKKTYIVGSKGYETKCGWSPFEGWELNGPVERVVLRGNVLVEKGNIV